MSFLAEFWIGLRGYGKAFTFIRTHKLWGYILVPALFNLFAFVFVGIVAWLYTGKLSDWLYGYLPMPADAGVWADVVRINVYVLVQGSILFVYLYLFKYIILLIFAPVLAIVSEKVQNVDVGSKRKISAAQLVKDIIRGISTGLTLVFFQLLFIGSLVLLTWLIPVVAPFTAVAIFVIESFFFGASMMDYRNEYHHFSRSQSLFLIRQHKGLALGNGIALNLLLLIPFLGVLFAPALAVMAAGLSANERLPHSSAV